MSNPLIDRAIEGGFPDPCDLPDDTSAEDRAVVALGIAVQYGGTDGEHHKSWVVDQMVRALVGIADYETFVDRVCDGEDGPETYSWDEGIAP